MVRPPSFDSHGIKKGAWSEDEDAVLTDYVLRFGHPNWRLLPSLAGLRRCGKSCRLRWVNYLKPGIKKGHFSKEEEDTIIELHSKLGKKWSDISKQLPGRTDNDIKNYWHAHINKRSRRKHMIRSAMEKKEESSEMGSSTTVDHQEEENSGFSRDFAGDLSAENPGSMLWNAYSACDIWTDPIFYDETYFDQALLPFPEDEFDGLGLCGNDMSSFSKLDEFYVVRPSPAESDENSRSQVFGEDAFEVELWV